ncbi:MAG: cation:proton antiporter [Candidatus Baltobacteraceae bacterium]
MALGYGAVVLAGVIAGALTHGRLGAFFGMVTLSVFLPALIFEAAWGVDAHEVRSHWKPVALLALPGVFITAGIIAIVTHGAGLAWQTALLLGAVLSATDPIAVVAIFRQLRVPAGLSAIVESESLLNDAMAVVLYRALLAGAALLAGIGVLAGLIAGAALGWLASVALRKAVAPWLQCAATAAGAYGSYLFCERWGWSGIFAVIAFAATLRELERRRLSVQSARAVVQFWAKLAVIANLVLFFLLGAAVDFTEMRAHMSVVTATIAAVLLARAVLAYGLLQLARERLKAMWMTVVRMAGIRGALCVALALATPAALAQRAALVDATFAVAVLSIVAASLTLRRRLEKFDL